MNAVRLPSCAARSVRWWKPAASRSRITLSMLKRSVSTTAARLATEVFHPAVVRIFGKSGRNRKSRIVFSTVAVSSPKRPWSLA